MTRTVLPEGVVLESRPCPNGCAADDEMVIEATDRLHGLPGRFRVVRCRRCGLLRTDPRPTPDTIGHYYPSAYGPYHKEVPAARTKAPTWHRRFKARLNRWLGKDVLRLPDIPPGHLLEVGCASGTYLKEMQARGWTVEGIEFSAEAAERARAMGLPVQNASVEDAHAPEKPADIVVAWMVLEHLHDPVGALRKLRSWTRPEGYLVAAVPDAAALERRMFGEYWYALQLPTHLYHYTPRTMRRVLAAAGWDLCAVRWQPNANNLLNSLVMMSEDRRWPRVLRLARWLKDAPRAAKLRRRLGWWLGITRQSGRMEFWARPRRA